MIIKPALSRCPECMRLFAPKPKRGARPVFCSREHQRTHNNRQGVRGKSLVILAQAWRQGRHKRGSAAAKMALTELCIALDRYTADDKADGRMSALDILAARYRADGIT